MQTIEFCRSEQLRCAAEFHDAGARLGLHDWFAEEFLMDIENHMTLPGPDHSVYVVEREDAGDRWRPIAKIAPLTDEQADVLIAALTDPPEAV